MRLLFLTHSYPPYELGGWPQNCAEIVELLSQRGHVSHVVTSRFGAGDEMQQGDGVTRALHFQAPIDYYRPIEFFLTRACNERENVSLLRTAIKVFRPDLCFVWGLWNLSRSLPYWAEQWLEPQRVAYAIADYWPMEPDIHESYWHLPARRSITEWAKTLVRPLVLESLRRERRRTRPQLVNVFCVSEYVRAKLVSSGALPHGARVIYNGIDPQPYLATARPKRSGYELRLLYFGGLSPSKGVHSAVEAMGILRQRGEADGLSLALVGDGHTDYLRYLEALVRQHALHEQVVSLGRVPRSSIPRVLSEHDVFLFTSIYAEPIARTVMEAMAAGLVVIGTAVGGQAEMLQDGANALVYPAGDAAALADRIVQLRETPGLFERLAEAGRQTVLERFTLERMVDEIEEWLEAIISGEASP